MKIYTTTHYLQRISYTIFILVFLALPLTGIHAEEGHDHAALTNFIEGQHYHRISPAVETDVEEGQVEVVELFWYGCPHCFQFEPYLKDWKETKADYISFKSMPAVLNRGWLAHARAYYALETMDELERVHPLFFEAIHTQGRKLRDAESISRFLSQVDVDTDKFKSAYDSLYVETKINRSGQLVKQYGVRSVPTVIINGKYRTSARDAGGHENVIRVINALAEQEAAANRSDSVEEETTE